MPGQVPGAEIDLDAGNNAGILEDLDEWPAVFRLLTNRFVIQDRAADGLIKTRRGDCLLYTSTHSQDAARSGTKNGRLIR